MHTLEKKPKLLNQGGYVGHVWRVRKMTQSLTDQAVGSLSIVARCIGTVPNFEFLCNVSASADKIARQEQEECYHKRHVLLAIQLRHFMQESK